MTALFNKTGDYVAIVYEDRVDIKSPNMLKEVKLCGIVIPPYRARDFGGRTVPFGSSNFPRAFKEIYCDHLIKTGYFWEKVLPGS